MVRYLIIHSSIHLSDLYPFRCFSLLPITFACFSPIDTFIGKLLSNINNKKYVALFTAQEPSAQVQYVSNKRITIIIIIIITASTYPYSYLTISYLLFIFFSVSIHTDIFQFFPSSDPKLVRFEQSIEQVQEVDGSCDGCLWPNDVIEGLVVIAPFLIILLIGVTCNFQIQSELKYEAERPRRF